jgi:hypothetical protein
MILEEFSNLMPNFVDNDFPIKHIPMIFNISMKLQVNEIDFDKHYNMLFPEFLEAFCRVIDKSSPPPKDNPVSLNKIGHAKNRQRRTTPFSKAC